MSDTQATPLDPETHDQADPADPVELEASTSSGSGIEATVETAPAEGGAPAASQGTAEATSPADEDGDEDSDEDAGPAGDADAHDGELAVGAVAESAADSAADSAVPEKVDRKARVRQLEREGEVAADFLETLLDIADLDGDIDVDVDGDRAAVAIVDSEEGRVPRRLVGPDGKVLEALQELTRLAVQVETGERSRLMLDIAGHRAQRRTTLVSLAQQAIAEVKESGSKRALEPMSAFERKVVHDEVAAAGLVSESEGVEPKRHVVVLPAGV